MGLTLAAKGRPSDLPARAGKRAAAVTSLIHSAKLNGLDPYAYMRDVLEQLPTQPASRIAKLLPHHWRPTTRA